MQKGSLIRSSRRQGSDVWEYRWRESCSGEKRKHRRIVIGSLDTLRDESAALKAISALRRDININDRRMKTKPLRLAELIEHFRQRELAADNEWKTLSTRVTYEGYLRKWIVPRWGATNLSAIRAVEVELWLRTLPLARASRAKIRNLMSVLFNHARRHDFTDHNPITLVRQSAKRRTVPEVLLPSEINRLVHSLRNRERTLVLLAAGTGLRMSELFGVKWRDVDFAGNRLASCDPSLKISRPVQNGSIPKAGPPRSTFGSYSSYLATLCALSSTDGLGFRQCGQPREVSILGTGPLATSHPA